MIRWREVRHIIKRIIVRGVLILDTPTCLGSGDTEGITDMMVLRDSISPNALVTGTSIAGALRHYLHEYECNYATHENRQNLAAKLFGDLFAYNNEIHLSEKQKLKIKEDDTQSPLIINDAISNAIPNVELRDGVKIHSVTQTAADKEKYDLELLEAGTEFNLNFELLIDTNEDTLIKALAIALQGLEKGEISLGIKKNRGFGRCHVEKWQVWRFDLREHEQRIEWLTFSHWKPGLLDNYPDHIRDHITDALGVNLAEEDKRQHLTITAEFTLASPLLIRSGQASTDKAPDVVHLKSRRNGELKSILSGTSLAGVLRHRAERIINTLKQNTNIINDIFGFVDENTKKAKASRLIVDEVEINNTTDLVQNRIAIDRFTGGALHGALFNEQPVFGDDETSLVIKLELRQPKHYEIGLLLLLLKDLWTGDLPVGGTSSIGRGRLQGKHATIEFDKKTWVIEQKSVNEPLLIDNAEDLETFVAALHQEVTA